MKYKLDIKRDVDGCEGDYMLYLPKGFRFYDDQVHCRGFDTLKELKESSKTEVVSCDCKDCQDHNHKWW